MKFYVEEREVETRPYIESLEVPRPNTVAFERVLNAVRRVRGLGEYIPEDIQKQIFIEMIPVRDDLAVTDSITGAQIAFKLSDALFTAGELLRQHSGYGIFDLWIMGRRYGQYTLSKNPGEYTELLENLQFIVDDDMGFNREEWGI